MYNVKNIFITLFFLLFSLTNNLFGNCESIILKNRYIKTALSCDATLGYGGKEYPGLQYDATGTFNFLNEEDVLIPGTPHELFSIKYDDIIKVNSNSSYLNPEMPTKIYSIENTIYAISTDDNLQILQSYRLNESSNIININVYIQNISPQSIDNVKYLRSIDPDYNFNEYSTINNRGNDNYTQENLVQADLPNGGAIALFTNEINIIHNTSISNWTDDPDVTLSGNDLGDGDNTIDIAFDLGTLAPKESKFFSFGYLLTTSLENISSSIVKNTIESNNEYNIFSYTQDANNSVIIPTTIEQKNLNLSDTLYNYWSLNDWSFNLTRYKVMETGISLNVLAVDNFKYTLVYTLPLESSTRFTGYYIHDKTNYTGNFIQLGEKQTSDEVGYSISEDGKVITITLKDNFPGDLNESLGVIKHEGFPTINEERIPSQAIKEETKSAPYNKLSNTILFSFMLFMGYIGLRKKVIRI